jgi:serine/threonine protein kinase
MNPIFNHQNSPQSLSLKEQDLIGKYQIVQKLGEGSFGIVWLVEDTEKKEKFALKILKLWEIPVKRQEVVIQRFNLEYEIGLSECKFLVQNYDYGIHLGNPYFIMKYYENGSLRNFLRYHEISIEHKIKICEDILHGLAFLHQNGKVHRDLRPENVLIDENFCAKLTDFGVAGHLQYQMTIVSNDGYPSEIFGNYAYMAAEQMKPTSRQETVLPALDLYAFGIVAYELFIGKLPFGPLETEQDLYQYLENAKMGRYTLASEINNQVPDIWNSAIFYCLKSNPRERIPNTKALFRFLQNEVQEEENVYAPINNFILKILDGEEPLKEYYINHQDRELYKMGRANKDSQNHVEIKEDFSPFISRLHCTLEWHDNAGWILRDGQWNNQLNTWKISKNGTYKNGIPIDYNFGESLSDGDIITVGNTTIKVIQ